MADRPTRETMREHADELAEVRVSALLQAIAMPHIDQETIERLLKDAISTSYVSGFADGWDGAVDFANAALQHFPRYRSE